MNNEEIAEELIKRFGIMRTMLFSEMASVMYDMMYEDVIKRDLEDICDLDFDRDWWREEFIKLHRILTDN